MDQKLNVLIKELMTLLDEHYDHDRAVKRFHIKEKSIIKELQEAGD